ncbi:hypothetical protein CFP66_40605 [Pseudonocardia sp. MH-G8]|nr:hypothetical protein CFP66_40605 [Pseudonocardia sp. MH-G8]
MSEPTASERYEIQARRLTRRDGAVVHDESRLARADSLDDAKCAANAWAADGFTVWIYLVGAGNGVRPTYQAVRTFPPVPAPPRNTRRHAPGAP